MRPILAGDSLPVLNIRHLYEYMFRAMFGGIEVILKKISQEVVYRTMLFWKWKKTTDTKVDTDSNYENSG